VKLETNALQTPRREVFDGNLTGHGHEYHRASDMKRKCHGLLVTRVNLRIQMCRFVVAAVILNK
jgi:hypothetical protein